MGLVLENSTERLYLKLANGQEWSLTSAEILRPWLLRFGNIMQLKPGGNNGAARMIFTSPTLFGCGGSLQVEDLVMDLPPTGWTPRFLGAMRVWTHSAEADVVCEMEAEGSRDIDVLRMWFSVDIIHARATGAGALPLHAGLVVRDGFSVLLAGPGGVGKSTCCRRIPAPWVVACDDEVLVVVNAQGQYRCHPFPTWSDHLWEPSVKTWNVQEHFPVRAILFLRQAERDSVQLVGTGHAAMLMNSSANQIITRQLRGLTRSESAALKRQVFDNACKLAQKTPAFVLSVKRNGSFWTHIDRALDLVDNCPKP